MRPGIDLVMVTVLALISALGAGPAGGDGQADQPGGLALARPYTRGKIPVVLIHGLGSSPRSWAPMIQGLEADPLLRERYQFWTFGYATGEPLLYSAPLLRQDLRAARRPIRPRRHRSGLRSDGPDRPQHGRPAGEDDGPGQSVASLGAPQPPAVRTARRPARGPRPVASGGLLQVPARGPPHHLHRDPPPGQPTRSGLRPRARHAALSGCRTRCSRFTRGCWRATGPTSSRPCSAGGCPPASINWRGSTPTPGVGRVGHRPGGDVPLDHRRPPRSAARRRDRRRRALRQRTPRWRGLRAPGPRRPSLPGPPPRHPGGPANPDGASSAPGRHAAGRTTSRRFLPISSFR